jgi:hypothetical protein
MRRENFLKLDPGAAAGRAGTVAGWNRLALQAIRAAQPGPLAAARSLAILHTCMYNAWAAYDGAARQTAHGVRVRLPCAERSAASKACAMSHAAWYALGKRFPGQQAMFDAWMAGLGLDPAPGGQLSPAGIGRIQAASMLDSCHRTGTPAATATTAEPAPGRWCLAAHRLSEREGHDDDRDVRLFFALANALADASIAGWGDARERQTVGPAAIHGSAGAAAHEVIRRFENEMRNEMRSGMRGRTRAGTHIGAGSAGQELGRQVGARAFDDARRHWEGRL